MNNKRFLTIKELAALAGVSPQSVYKRVDNSLADYVQLVDGQKMIEFSALKEVYHIEVDNVCKPTVDNDVEQLKATVELLRSQITAKDNQLAEKDKQLTAKDTQISRLQDTVESLTHSLNDTTKALTAAQSLHAGTMQQQLIEAETVQEGVSDTDTAETAETTGVTNVEQPKKATFRERLNFLLHGK